MDITLHLLHLLLYRQVLFLYLQLHRFRLFSMRIDVLIVIVTSENATSSHPVQHAAVATNHAFSGRRKPVVPTQTSLCHQEVCLIYQRQCLRVLSMSLNA